MMVAFQKIDESIANDLATLGVGLAFTLISLVVLVASFILQTDLRECCCRCEMCKDDEMDKD